MSLVYAFLADGMEEIECLAVVDVLRRAQVEVRMISVMGRCAVTGAHGITVEADALLDETDLSGADCLFLPGGMPGTTHLGACTPLVDALHAQVLRGGRIAAICAAPSVLGKEGLLRGKKATCFPGFESSLSGAEYEPHAAVVTDGTVTTARGMGCAVDLGLELVRLLADAGKAEEIRRGIQYPGTF